MCEFVRYGFGYDSVHDDYRVVRIAQFPNVVQNDVRIYSLKSNGWRMGKDFPYRLCCTTHGVFVSDALHWLVILPDKKMVSMIVSFNLGTEEYGLLPGPSISHVENMSILREL